jgi:rhodanese-related sulfurtransferase
MEIIIEGIPHLNQEELKAIVDDPLHPAIVIDVREPEEYIAGHIPAVPLIPIGQIADYIDRFDKDIPYVFVCQSGIRSLRVAQFFQAHGFARVYNFAGGMKTWKGDIAFGPENIVTSFNPEQLSRKGRREGGA